jgi:hypothetical protein
MTLINGEKYITCGRYELLSWGHVTSISYSIVVKNFPRCEDLRKCKGNNFHIECGTHDEIIITSIKIVLLQLINITPPIYRYQ